MKNLNYIMKYTLILLFVTSLATAQESDFDLSKIRFKKLQFRASKDEIIRAEGQPEIKDTNYDCGAYAKDQPDGPYHQLRYKGFNYIGNDKEDFVLENVTFDPKGKVKLAYGNVSVSGLTTKPEFIKMFESAGKKFFVESTSKESILLFAKDTGDGAKFFFQDGKLIKYEYWSPC